MRFGIAVTRILQHSEGVPATLRIQRVIQKDPQEARPSDIETETARTSADPRRGPFAGERRGRRREQGIPHLVESRRGQPHVPVAGENVEFSAALGAEPAQRGIERPGVGRVERDGPPAGAGYARPERVGPQERG